MSHVLDLSHRAWTKKARHGLLLIGTWLTLPDGRHRPCMVIVRAGEEFSDRTVPCIVTVDRAWIWSEEIGDPALAARIAFQFAQVLRLNEHDPKTMIFLAMLINDHLDDLLHIKPYQPPAPRKVVAEITITDRQTGRTREAEVLE